MSAVPRLHAVTDDARLAAARFVRDAAAVLEAGGADLALHLRGRTTTAVRLYALATTLLPIARAAGAKLLVNDRIDVALAAHADGAHLREDSIDAARARAILGDQALLGVSRHAASVGRADDGAADFVVFGHAFETASHPGAPPAGLDGLRDAVGATARPVIAIGGITPERVAAVIGTGAHGVATLSGAWDGGPRAVADYVAALAGRS